MAFDSEIKFRCDEELVARFARIALLERRDRSDLARIVFEDYITTQERALNLVLRDKPDNPGLAAVPSPQTETSYHQRRKRRK